MVRLQTEPIDHAELVESVRTNAAGAVVLFLGTVREVTAGRRTDKLTYEAYFGMAEKEMAAIEAEVRQRWPICEVNQVHRLGKLDLGEISVAVALSAPHRAQAFEAGRYAIDELKKRVPIWKQEHWADGTTDWVHPS